MSSIGTVGTISCFQRRKYDVFYWKINQFSKLSEKADDFYYKTAIDSKGLRSYFYFYPNGRQGLFPGFFGLYFSFVEHKEPSCVHLTLGLKTVSERIEKWFSGIIICPVDILVGSSALIHRTEFFKRKQELAPSDCVTFVIFLRPGAPELIRDVADRTETGNEEDNDDEEKEGNEKVLDDMSKLLASGDRSDATIVVDEVEYKVHSCILATRTPVFAALFEHDTLEKATRKITITDCEPAIFKEFLNYIYTGSAQNLTAENSLGLYRVADKYLVKDLKKVCRECIQDNLTTETFCEAVQLALKCGDKELLESAFDYCVSNFKLIIRSVEWQRYIEENPREANEVLIKSFGPL